MTLFPVVMPVYLPTKGSHNSPCSSCLDWDNLIGQGKGKRLSLIAREALKLSAQKSGVKHGELRQAENGAPCPIDGIYWSLSHKSKYVAAVVSNDKVGIDIEEIKPRAESLFSYVVSDEEWELQERSWDVFFRYWTAKEAVLKAIGIGVRGLKTCRVVSVPNENHLVLDYKGQVFLVEQLRHNSHIVSVVKNNNRVEWVILGQRQVTGSYEEGNTC